MFGNNDNRVDTWPPGWSPPSCASCASIPTYRNALHTQSVLTITSNVVYGKATGNTPDGRRQGRAFRAGRQPDARARQPRHPCLGRIGREDPLSRRAGRDFADDDAGADRARPDARMTGSPT